MPTIPAASATPNIHFFTLPIVPPFPADRFAWPPRLALSGSLALNASLGLPLLIVQTRFSRKVVRNFSAVRGLMPRNSDRISALPKNASVRLRYPELRLMTLVFTILFAMALAAQ
jgi:hypothetical protein